MQYNYGSLTCFFFQTVNADQRQRQRVNWQLSVEQAGRHRGDSGEGNYADLGAAYECRLS